MATAASQVGLVLTPQADLRGIFERQRAHAPAMARTTAAERIERLARLRRLIVAHRSALTGAVHADFGRPVAESELTEIFSVLSEIDHCSRHLKGWMKPERRLPPLLLFGTSSRIAYEPLGVTLIMAPWNYPIGLLLNPLVAAIGAGNCAVLKPSEKTSHVAAALTRMIHEGFDPVEVAIVEGGADVAQALLELPFDHICFTGSTQVGRIVMAAAAKHLATVTLELGGKSPAIVDASADIAATADRIAYGKFMNAGQTCIAPDYVLVERSRERALLKALQQSVGRFYGASEADRRHSPDFARVVDAGHFQRLKGLFERSVAEGARIITGGEMDAGTRYIAPTILADVTPSMPVMQEEIFGPILPVLSWDTREDVVQHVRAGGKPLAMYVFAGNRAAADYFTESLSAGATVHNNVGLHYFHHGVPFGGVGASGQGAYHGVRGFRAFSHAKPMLRQHEPALVPLLFPPYRPGSLGDRVLKLLEKL